MRFEKGSKHTPESKAKMAIAIKKLWEDPEYRAKQISKRKGHKPTPEARANMKAAKARPEWRAKMRASALERWQDPSYQAMRSTQVKKQWQDPEIRAKMIKLMHCPRPYIPRDTQVCPDCDKEFPTTMEFFYKSSKYKYGLEALCKGCSEIRRHNRHAKIKVDVLTHYGDGKFACIACEKTDFDILTIDHINGNGNQHRRESHLGGITFYRWLIKQGFPEDYQTLCYNCQMKKCRLHLRSHDAKLADKQMKEWASSC